MSMENKNAIIGIAVVAVVAIIAVTAVSVWNNGNSPGEDIYRLYVGMNDSITHEDYDPEYATAVVDKIVVNYSDGFTRYIANGGWRDENGIMCYENSLVYMIQGIDSAKVKKICDEVKEALNQSSVLVTISRERADYY